MTLYEAMGVVEAGMKAWRDKPHNARWWRLIDGTPIPNDLIVCIAEAVANASASADRPSSAVNIDPSDDKREG